MPQTLRSVLTRRLGGLSTAARELVGVAGAIGREFRYPLLARASQMDESALVQALDELWLRRVIQIQQADAYNFTHGKLQEAAYEALSAPRRQLLHRKIAEALEAEREDPAVIARHWDAGGQSAGAVVVERLGELEKLGEYYFLLPTAYFRRDGYQVNDEIMRYSKLALETSAQTDNLELQTRTNFGYGFCHFLRGDFDEAIHYLGEGLRLAEQISYVELQLMSVTYLAAAYRGAGRVEDCQTCAERALTLSEREGTTAYVAAARANLGWAAWKRNDLRQARALSQSALKMWGAGYPFRWLALWTLIDLNLLALRVDEALEYARKLKEPHQQVFEKEGDELLAQALSAEAGNAASLLAQALEWAKKRGYL